MANPGFKPELLQQAVDLVVAHGNVGAASRFARIPYSTLESRFKEAGIRGLTAQNVGPMAGERASAAEGYVIKGISTLYDADGVPKAQWVKTTADQLKMQAMQEASFRAAMTDLKPLPTVAQRGLANTDLLNLYTMTDCHVGMLAWDKEAGEDWDLNIAEDCLVGTFMQMIESAPAASVGIVNQLGDFLHFDSLSAVTPTNHHILDADSRYQKMVEVAVRILRAVISKALEKHERVQVYMHEGNHDPAGSVWLRVMFAQLYAGNPRVTVGMSPNPYVAYCHGKTLLGFHHGHLTKAGNLPLIFAGKYPKEWGQTEYRYVHIGHKHHVEEKEHPGIKVVQHPTLAAPDAYAARGGWLSKRQATSITYSKELGEVARGVFVPQTRITNAKAESNVRRTGPADHSPTPKGKKKGRR